MSSASLQILAVCAMVVDHGGMALFPEVSWLRWVGRLSFPLFVFLLCEGFIHTSSRKRYALRLAVFAVISEGPYQLLVREVYGGRWEFPCQNVFFELLAALGALWCAQRGGLWLLGAGGIAAAAELLGMDYGGYGILLAACLFLCREKPVGVSLSLTACTALYCVVKENPVQGWAVLAAVPMVLYNGQRGRRLPRYFLYVFYPAHLLVLALLRQLG